MLVVIDIGNTNITMGVYRQDELIGNYRLTTKFQRTSDEYGFMLLSFLNASSILVEDIEDIIISSVVPKINYSFTNCIKKYLHKNPIFIGPGVKTGIDIRIDKDVYKRQQYDTTDVDLFLNIQYCFPLNILLYTKQFQVPT